MTTGSRPKHAQLPVRPLNYPLCGKEGRGWDVGKPGYRSDGRARGYPRRGRRQSHLTWSGILPLTGKPQKREKLLMSTDPGSRPGSGGPSVGHTAGAAGTWKSGTVFVMFPWGYLSRSVHGHQFDGSGAGSAHPRFPARQAVGARPVKYGYGERGRDWIGEGQTVGMERGGTYRYTVGMQKGRG